MDNKIFSIGLMTMSNVINFGSILQTYATIKVLEKLGFNCVLIDYHYPSLWHIENATGNENKKSNLLLRSLIKTILRSLGILYYARAIKIFINHKKSSCERIIFQNFLKDLPKTPQQYNRKSILKNPPLFDIYMTGSDQTWNSRYMHTDYSFLLNFVPDEAPKIAYAASFGAKKISSEYRKDYEKFLSRYDRISVREQSGVTLIKELTGKDVAHTPDPSLMLSADEWRPKIKNKLQLPDKFIFCYIQDYVFSPYPHLTELVEHLAQISRLPVVVSGGSAVKITENCILLTYDIGPEGFLECFDKASFVITTSFHGTAFSVNFEKDFFAVLNPNATADDRVKSFLDSVHLNNRGLVLPRTVISDITLEDMKTNHKESRIHLQKMREDSLEYLKEALEFSVQKMAGVHDV